MGNRVNPLRGRPVLRDDEGAEYVEVAVVIKLPCELVGRVEVLSSKHKCTEEYVIASAALRYLSLFGGAFHV